MGGGLANLGDLTFSNSQVLKNRTAPGGNGGGLYLGAKESDGYVSIVQNTEVISNSASGNGGGIYSFGNDSQWENLIVAGNKAGNYPSGHGIFLADHEIHMNHLSIANNTSFYGSGMYVISATAFITNSIIAGQYTGISTAEQGNVTMEGTLWGAGPWANIQDWVSAGSLVTGTHNLWADPLFIDPAQMIFTSPQLPLLLTRACPQAWIWIWITNLARTHPQTSRILAPTKPG